MTDVVSLRIPAKAQYLVFCRLVLAGLSRAEPIDPETLADLKLAVTEACSSAVRTADREAPGEISIRYELGGGQVAVEVLGNGSVDDLKAAELDESGLGFALIQAVVDELEVESAPAGAMHRLRFRKRL